MTTPQQNGLHRWRQRKTEEKERIVAELDEYRKDAVPVERDGRTFMLVRIPDRHDEERAEKVWQRIEPRRKNKQAAS